MRQAGGIRRVRLLTDKGPLRAGLEANAAVDTLWLLMSPNNHYRLVHERGWTKAKYQRWLADTIEQLLLPAHP
jgi:hypothetical protein